LESFDQIEFSRKLFSPCYGAARLKLGPDTKHRSEA
jgi:hypothetical protein